MKVIYYSIQNGGDGSAYPIYFETQELANWDQDNMDEGWAETCSGKLLILGDNVTVEESMNKDAYLLYLMDRQDTLLKTYIQKFYPNGVPEFNVRFIGGYEYAVYIENRYITKLFRSLEKGHEFDRIKHIMDEIKERFSLAIGE